MRLRQHALALAALATASALAQDAPTLPEGVEITDPDTWLTDQATVFAVATWISYQITRLLTALGKESLVTSGRNTVYLSGAVALVIAGVGGYFGLGYLTGATGFAAAAQAALMAGMAFVGANARAKYDRQSHAAALTRVERTKSKLL